MAGTYSHLKSQLEKAEEDPDRKAELDKVKEKFAGKTIGEIGDAFRAAYDLHEKIKKQEYDANIDLEALGQLLVNDLEASGIDKMRTSDGSTTLFIKDDVRCSMTNREEYLNWIRQENMEELLTVHYSTMNAQAKDRLQKGKPLPPGLKAFFQQKMSIRRNSK